jgi:hypothetical protein
LALVPTPPGTTTHKPVPHIEVVNALLETLAFRHITVVRDEYAVDKTGAKMFGVMELDQGMEGARFVLGLRNSHDKSFRLAVTVGLRVFVCENLAFNGDYSPVLAKHSKHFSLQNALSIGVDDMQRNFQPMVEAVDTCPENILDESTVGHQLDNVCFVGARSWTMSRFQLDRQKPFFGFNQIIRPACQSVSVGDE